MKDPEVVRSIDAKATHILGVSLISCTVFALLMREHAWDWQLVVGAAILTLACLGLYWRHDAITLGVISTFAILGALATIRSDPLFREIVWIAFAATLWLVAMELLRGSPAITEAYGWSLVATVLGVAIVVVLVWLAHMMLWSSVSIALLGWALIFSWLTTEL